MKAIKTSILILTAAGLVVCAACSGPSVNQPPTISYDVDECIECGMIISDERYATATIVPGDRGPYALLFDDFNCQVLYETAHPDLKILRRWAHDHSTREWIDATTAHYVRAETLYTPMMAHVAAFRSGDDAKAAQAELSGEILDFETLWAALRTQ